MSLFKRLLTPQPKITTRNIKARVEGLDAAASGRGHITVRLTRHEAECLLLMAGSGDYQSYDDALAFTLKRPSNRAEAKIRRALVNNHDPLPALVKACRSLIDVAEQVADEDAGEDVPMPHAAAARRAIASAEKVLEKCKA